MNSQEERKTLLILYGTHTGTAKAFARMLGTYAVSHGLEPVVCCMNDGIPSLKAEMENKSGSRSRAVLFITSTWGLGEFPTNCLAFYKALQAGELTSFFAGVPYAVLGLGNSRSERYNTAAKNLDAALQKIGAKSFLPLQLSCDQQPSGHDDVFRAWKSRIWAALGCSSVNALGTLYDLKPTAVDKKEESLAQLPGFERCRLRQNDLLTPEGYLPESRLATVSIPLETQKKLLGCHANSNDYLVEILPHSSDALVARALERLKVAANDTFTVVPLSGASASPFDNTVLSARAILRDLVDISSIPTRSFLEALASIATEDEDKENLQDLANDLGARSKYEKLSRGVFSVIDLLEMFPRLQVSLSQLLTHAPHNHQRSYSIANDIEEGKDVSEFQFCYSVPLRTTEGRSHEGLCSGMLSRIHPNSEGDDGFVYARLVKGNITRPQLASPVAFIALGTGIGSIRAILQQRQAAKNRGEEVGPSKLFYGFRHSGKNDIFRSDMEAFEAAGLVTCCFVASHDQPEFKTPMEEMDASLVEFLGAKGQIMYCGLGGSVPVAVEGHLRRCAVDISALRLGGRYHTEYYTPDHDVENLLNPAQGAADATTLAARVGESDMFCFQCQQTFKNVGCSVMGVCGKTPSVSALQDLTIHSLKTLGFYLHELREMGCPEQKSFNHLTLSALFHTITNVNFDESRFEKLLRTLKSSIARARVSYTKACKAKGVEPVKKESITIPEEQEDIESLLVNQGRDVGVLSRFVNPETQSAACVTEMLMYGLKGLAAYSDHSLMNNMESTEVYEFIHRTLHFMSGQESFDLGKGLAMCLEAGKANVTAMSLLYNSNKSLGVPTITNVPNTPKAGKCILVSGHDLIILKGLLEKTEPLGINVYTHGEMLPAHSYPELHKFKTLYGQFGGAWMRQSTEFRHFPGPILMTTNCLTEPHETYAARLFTAGAVGWKNVPHIGDTVKNINFDDVIAAAQATSGFGAEEEQFSYADPIGATRAPSYTVGFGHETVLSVAPTIVSEIQKGNITRFFLIGGCDGYAGERSYYTELVSRLPKTAVVLTLGCGKYRFNHLDLGTIGDTGIPRILDMGQCNDSFSAVQVALALADVLGCAVGDLPLSIVLSWFEQKAIAVLFSCLHLGLKPIYVGPSLPAFMTPEVVGVLVKDFGVRPVGDPEEDLEVMLNAKGMGWTSG